MNGLDQLYRDILMDHYKYPRGKKKIENPDIVNSGQNPLCGDSIELTAKLDGGRIAEIGVETVGCAICTASASMLTEIVKGMTISEVEQLASLVTKMLTGDDEQKDFDLGDLEALAGVKKFPVRVKCALLAWITLIEGIRAHQQGVKPEAVTTE